MGLGLTRQEGWERWKGHGEEGKMRGGDKLLKVSYPGEFLKGRASVLLLFEPLAFTVGLGT